MTTSIIETKSPSPFLFEDFCIGSPAHKIAFAITGILFKPGIDHCRLLSGESDVVAARKQKIFAALCFVPWLGPLILLCVFLFIKAAERNRSCNLPQINVKSNLPPQPNIVRKAYKELFPRSSRLDHIEPVVSEVSKLVEKWMKESVSVKKTLEADNRLFLAYLAPRGNTAQKNMSAHLYLGLDNTRNMGTSKFVSKAVDLLGDQTVAFIQPIFSWTSSTLVPSLPIDWNAQDGSYRKMMLRSFLSEYQELSRLRNTDCLNLVIPFQTPPRLCVMIAPFVTPLDDYLCSRSEIPWKNIAKIGSGACSGLDFLAQKKHWNDGRGRLMLDIKVGNMGVRKVEDEFDSIMLFDFGFLATEKLDPVNAPIAYTAASLATELIDPLCKRTKGVCKASALVYGIGSTIIEVLDPVLAGVIHKYEDHWRTQDVNTWKSWRGAGREQVHKQICDKLRTYEEASSHRCADILENALAHAPEARKSLAELCETFESLQHDSTNQSWNHSFSVQKFFSDDQLKEFFSQTQQP